MASSGGGAESAPDPDELRRRIYRSDATDDDRERYRDLIERTQPARVGPAGADADPAPSPVQLPSLAPASRPRSRRHRRGLLLAGTLGVVALAGIGVGLLPRAKSEPPAPSPQAISVDGPTRSEFVQNLAGGGAAGIAAYLVTHRSPLPLRSANRYFTIERKGSGPGAFSLNGTPPEAITGRATVLLVLEVDARAAWTAYRIHSRTSGPDPEPFQVVTRRGDDLRAGVLTTATFPYASGGRPVRLDVDVPAGVRWGAAVVFTN